MTRTRLLGQQERGRKKQRTKKERAREAATEEGGKLVRETAGIGGASQGKQRVLGALRRQECIGAFGVHSNAGGNLDVRTRDSTPELNPRFTSVRSCQTVAVLKGL